MKNNKSKVLSILVILIIAAAIGSGVYVYIQKNSTNKEASKILSTTTANDEKAFAVVRNYPQVKLWLQLFSNPDGTSPKTGAKPVMFVDGVTDTIYTVKVYQLFPDGHTISSGWYDVDIKSEKIVNTYQD